MREIPEVLITCLSPYGEELSQLFLSVRDRVLSFCPGANELIYDSYNAVSCAYSFSENLKEAFCHIAVYRDHVNLGFNRGNKLHDPENQLIGTGKSIRHISIFSAKDLDRSGRTELIGAAVQQGVKLAKPKPGNGKSVVKARSEKKRPK